MSKLIRRDLTGSRIDNCLLLYTIIQNLYYENDTDKLEEDYIFAEVMKRSKGSFNPLFVKLELEKI
jgi:hypothetical protein